MGFSVSTLTDYTDQLSRQLISRLYFEGTSGQYFEPMVGIKSSKTINLIDPSASPQADTGCAFLASGSTSLTQRTLTVGKIKYEDTLCLADLEAKYTQIFLRQGHDAGRQDINNMVLDEVHEAILMQIKEDNERADWQGDTTLGDQFLNKYDGLIKIIDAASGVVTGNTGSVGSITSGSSGNADTVVNDMIAASPAALKRKTGRVLFVGTDFFDDYISTLLAKNLFHINVNADRSSYTYRIPSWNVEMVGVHGLDGTNRMFLGQRTNFVLGMDGTGDEDSFEMWYSKDDRNIKYHVGFKRGTQVAKPDEIVQFTLV